MLRNFAGKLAPGPLALMSARRPWTTIGIWVLVIIVSIGLRATLFEDAISTEFAFTSNPDFKQADDLLEDRLLGPKGTNEVVICWQPAKVGHFC